MSSVGGGLHDKPSYGYQPTPNTKALAREWFFWACMAFGVWGAFQGQPQIALFFLGTGVFVSMFVFLGHEVVRQVRENGWWK